MRFEVTSILCLILFNSDVSKSNQKSIECSNFKIGKQAKSLQNYSKPVLKLEFQRNEAEFHLKQSVVLNMTLTDNEWNVTKSALTFINNYILHVPSVLTVTDLTDELKTYSFSPVYVTGTAFVVDEQFKVCANITLFTYTVYKSFIDPADQSQEFGECIKTLLCTELDKLGPDDLMTTEKQDRLYVEKFYNFL